MPVQYIIERTTERTFEAVEIEPADPFGIDDPCDMNGGGPHCDLREGHEIVCARCSRVVWA